MSAETATASAPDPSAPYGSATAPAAPRTGLTSRPAVVLLLYSAVSVAMTWPLAPRMFTHIPDGGADLWHNLWNQWLWAGHARSVFSGGMRSGVWFTRDLFFPDGTDLTFHTHSFFNVIMALPVSISTGPGPAYNLCVLAGGTMCGFFQWVLVRDLTGNSSAAFVSGLVFAWFPQRVEFSLENINLHACQFMPLTACLLLRVLREGGKTRAAALGSAWTLNALCSWHLGLELTLVLIGVALWEVTMRPPPFGRILRDLSLAAAIALLLISPFVTPLILRIAEGETWFRKNPTLQPIDIAFLFYPMPEHPIWGDAMREVHRLRAYSGAGYVCYLGLVPVTLACAAMVRRVPGRGMWFALLVVCLVLSMGERPFWNGEILHGSPPLPWLVIPHIPFLSVLRIANRFMIPASMGLAVLVGLGWTTLPGRCGSRAGLVLITGLILLEYAWLPYPVRPGLHPHPIRELGRDAGPGAVIHIPWFDDVETALNLYYQTGHGRPMAGGYVSARSPGSVRSSWTEPSLRDTKGSYPRPPRPADLQHLRELGFAWMVIHTGQRHSLLRNAHEAAAGRTWRAEMNSPRTPPIGDDALDALLAAMREQCGPPRYSGDGVEIYDFGSTPGRTRGGRNL